MMESEHYTIDFSRPAICDKLPEWLETIYPGLALLTGMAKLDVLVDPRSIINTVRSGVETYTSCRGIIIPVVRGRVLVSFEFAQYVDGHYQARLYLDYGVKG